MGKEVFYRSGDRYFFLDTINGTSLLMEADIKTGETIFSPGLPRNSEVTNGFFAESGGTLFFQKEGSALFRRSPTDLSWQPVVSALPEGSLYQLLASGPFVFALIQSPTSEEALFFEWREGREGWQKFSLPESAGYRGSVARYEVLGGNLFIFILDCPPGISCADGSNRPHETLYVYAPDTRHWSAVPLPQDSIKQTVTTEQSLLLLGEKNFYRYDPAKRAFEVVAERSKIFEFLPELKVGGDVAYVATNDKIYFYDEHSKSLVDPLSATSNARQPWSNSLEQNHVLVRGDRAIIQMIRWIPKNETSDKTARYSLGYFEKKDGIWYPAGFLEGVSGGKPVDLTDRGLLYAGSNKISLLPVGLKNCESQGSDRKDSALLNFSVDTFVHGRIVESNQKLCRLDIEYAFYGWSFRQTLRIEGGLESGFLKNFGDLHDGDLVSLRLKTNNGVLSTDRIFIESREGLPVPGQTPIFQEKKVWLALSLCFSFGLAFLFWGIRTLARAGENAFLCVFPDRLHAVAANKLRTTGFALLGLAFLTLAQGIGGRPNDVLELIEVLSIRLGAFLVGFAIIYYVGAINLLKFFKTTKANTTQV